MKKVMITSAAVALAFGLAPYAGAQVDNGSAAAKNDSTAVVKTKIDDSYNQKTINADKKIDIDITKNDNDTKTVTKTYTDNSDNSKTITKNDNDNYTKTFTKNDNDTKTVTKTYTDSNNDTKIKDSYNEKTKWDGKAKNDYSPFGAAANNHSTAYTSLDMKDSFNQTKIVNVTKLDGLVSGNNVYGTGNSGGNASSFSPGGYGGDGYAKSKAKSGDSWAGNGGDGGKAKAGDGYNDADGGYAKGGKGGYADAGKGGNSYASRTGGHSKGDAKAQEGGDGGYAKGGKGGYAEGGEARAEGGNGGKAKGGNGAEGGSAESGYAASRPKVAVETVGEEGMRKPMQEPSMPRTPSLDSAARLV
ncbi:hypothetical protein YTPLAS72_04870 [Nitrospira sp.]|nr:hypothetical protein YTPLAS72_04870 [Nitrospira sp.]